MALSLLELIATKHQTLNFKRKKTKETMGSVLLPAQGELSTILVECGTAEGLVVLASILPN